jgi:hypothetical protein
MAHSLQNTDSVRRSEKQNNEINLALSAFHVKLLQYGAVLVFMTTLLTLSWLSDGLFFNELLLVSGILALVLGVRVMANRSAITKNTP